MSATETDSKFQLWVPDKCLHEPQKEYVIAVECRSFIWGEWTLSMKGLWQGPAGMAETGRQ